MCGIMGWMLPEGVLDREQRMALAATLVSHMENRGLHSYGYYLEDGTLQKDTGPAALGMKLPDIVGSRFWMGHTRFATVGPQTKENAHPWRFTRKWKTRDGREEHEVSIVGLHNGGINNHEELNRRHNRKCSVDSQHIFLHLLDGLPMTELRGYGAIAFATEPHDLWGEGRIAHLGRFYNGSLEVFGIGKNADSVEGVVFASTYNAIQSGLRMAGLSRDQYFNFRVDAEVLYYLTGEFPFFYRTGGKQLAIGYGYKQTRQEAAAAARPTRAAGFTSQTGGTNGNGNRTGGGTSQPWLSDIRDMSKPFSEGTQPFDRMTRWRIAVHFIGVHATQSTTTERCGECQSLADFIISSDDSKWCRLHFANLVERRDRRIVLSRSSGGRSFKEEDEAEKKSEGDDELVIGCDLCDRPAIGVSRQTRNPYCMKCANIVQIEKLLPLPGAGDEAKEIMVLPGRGGSEEDFPEAGVVAESPDEDPDDTQEFEPLVVVRPCQRCGEEEATWRLIIKLQNVERQVPNVIESCKACAAEIAHETRDRGQSIVWSTMPGASYGDDDPPPFSGGDLGSFVSSL